MDTKDDLGEAAFRAMVNLYHAFNVAETDHSEDCTCLQCEAKREAESVVRRFYRFHQSSTYDALR